jgi:hypothetical protein
MEGNCDAATLRDEFMQDCARRSLGILPAIAANLVNVKALAKS